MERLRIKCDLNLLHLQNVLFDLDNYNFKDREIYRMLNELSSYVATKISKNIYLIVLLDCFTCEDTVLLTLKNVK